MFMQLYRDIFSLFTVLFLLEAFCLTINVSWAPLSNLNLQDNETTATSEIVRIWWYTEFCYKWLYRNCMPVLNFVFNFSWFQNICPNFWKQREIIPVFKKRQTFSVSNFRLITLLPVFPRVSNLLYMITSPFLKI
jgi:hypothetical protein